MLRLICYSDTNWDFRFPLSSSKIHLYYFRRPARHLCLPLVWLILLWLPLLRLNGRRRQQLRQLRHLHLHHPRLATTRCSNCTSLRWLKQLMTFRCKLLSESFFLPHSCRIALMGCTTLWAILLSKSLIRYNTTLSLWNNRLSLEWECRFQSLWTKIRPLFLTVCFYNENRIYFK